MAEMIKREKAFKLMLEIAVNPARQITKEEADEMIYFIPELLNRMGCWFSIWTPSDVQDYAFDVHEWKTLDYEKAKVVCENLENYEYIYSEINEAVGNAIKEVIKLEKE